MTPEPTKQPDAPPPLTVAASVVALEALVYAVIGVIELVVTDAENPVVGISTGLFFLLFAAFLAFCAYRFWRLESWARAPIVMTQLLQIPVGLSFWGGGGWTNVVTVVAIVASVVVVAGVFHPDSLAALAEAE